MSIKDLSIRIHESGRIRIGQKKVAKSGKSFPSKLDHFRLTSADKSKLDRASELWGGTVQEWESPDGKQWELFTDADELAVILPPTALAFSQWMETWSGGGCLRRCDGEFEQITEGGCICKSTGEQECKPHTRLSLILPDLDGIGLWRLDTQGFNAAAELAGVVGLVSGLGTLLPAKLRLEQRSSIKAGQTRRFAVPTLDLEMPARQIMAADLKRAQIGLPQFSVAEPLSQEVRGQMMALARQKGLTDQQRHELSEGVSWSEEGRLSNAEGQKILAAMREMPDAKVIDAKLYTPADPETEPVTDEEWEQVGHASHRGPGGDGTILKPSKFDQPELTADQQAQKEYRETSPGAFDCPAVHEDGVRQCINTKPHTRAHVWEEVKGRKVSA
jgi:hypothetical protein